MVGAAIVAIAIMVTLRDQSTAGRQAAAPPKAVGSSRGNLRVEVNVPARATLDGWHLPDGGPQAATVLLFSDVEATTHTLEVWSEGYRRESSSVAIKAGQTTRVTVNLQRAGPSAAGHDPAWFIDRRAGPRSGTSPSVGDISSPFEGGA
jgi:hypothetical protein